MPPLRTLRRRVLTGGLLLFTLLFSAAPHASAAPGDLDLSFGTGGRVTAAFIPGGYNLCRSVSIQADGKIILAGRSGAQSSGYDGDLALLRLNSDGSPDEGFGTGGKVTTDLRGGGEACNAVAVQRDGKIVVAGGSGHGSRFLPTDIAVARYHTDGRLDTAFGADGAAFAGFGRNNSTAYSVAIQNDGGIVVCGSVFNGANTDMVLVRFDAEGKPDSGFGAGGRVTEDFGGYDYGISVVVQRDGRIVTGGQALRNGDHKGDFALVRHNADGTPDKSFGKDGRVRTDFADDSESVMSLALQEDGKIIAGGYAWVNRRSTFAVARYTASGALDPAFGGGGKVTVEGRRPGGDSGNSVNTLPGGRILLSGDSGYGLDNDFMLLCFRADGSLDAGFGAGGRVVTPFPAGYEVSNGAAVAKDGGIVLVGNSGPGLPIAPYDVAVARYSGFPVLTRLEEWRETRFGSPENTGDGADSADPDRDGLSNLLEWAAGSDPKTFSAAPGTLSRTDGNGEPVLEFTYTRSLSAVQAGAVFAAEWSDHPPSAPWSTAGFSESVSSEDASVQRVKAVLPAGDGPRRFVRLKVTTP